MNDMPVLSAVTDVTPLVAVIPVVREPADIAGAIARYRSGLADIGRPLRFVVVLDGPQPRSREALRALRGAGQPIEILSLPHPMGEAAALSVGLAAAGDTDVLTLPADPSVEPADLPGVVAALERQDMVVATRGENAGKLDWALRHVFGSPFRDVRSPVRAMRAEVAAELQPYGNQHRFLPLIAQSQGFNVGEITTRAAEPPPSRRRRILPKAAVSCPARTWVPSAPKPARSS